MIDLHVHVVISRDHTEKCGPLLSEVTSSLFEVARLPMKEGIYHRVHRGHRVSQSRRQGGQISKIVLFRAQFSLIFSANSVCSVA